MLFSLCSSENENLRINFRDLISIVKLTTLSFKKIYIRLKRLGVFAHILAELEVISISAGVV